MVKSVEFGENENPNFTDGCNINGKQGMYVKGRDVIHLDAPEIQFPKNAPLHNTDKRELYAILDELFQEGEGGGDDWQPPDWWIPVPEPEPYDIYILVWAYKGAYGNTGMDFSLYMCRESDNYMGQGNIHCDFGDGTILDLYPYMLYSNIKHTYTKEGQYLIHIVTDENTNCWYNGRDYQSRWQIVKTGKNIAFVTDYNEQNGYPFSINFSGKDYLKYIQINHPKGLPITEYFLQSCQALQKIEVKKKSSGNILKYAFQLCSLTDFSKILNEDEITFVGDSAFQGCYDLKSINLPNVTSVESSAFATCYNLETVYLPNCTYVGNSAFQTCNNLRKIIVAENCTFGTNCFQYCRSLYPRPDGSVN